ncbi:YlxR family protein [Frigoribacterium sp. 2-23]|uniref:YlxR family protein n=1 Tax=Frigoribacterium sp. 2-23 TaxID=3415006 RepID=UPI003C6ED751
MCRVGWMLQANTHPTRHIVPRGRGGRQAEESTVHTPFALGVHPEESRGGRVEPVRTCIGTRTRAPRSSLVRVVARDGRLVVDSTAALPGRGAWLTPSIDAFEAAVRRRAFRRALRLDFEPDTGDLREYFARVTTDTRPVATTEQAERHMDN